MHLPLCPFAGLPPLPRSRAVWQAQELESQSVGVAHIKPLGWDVEGAGL